MHVLAHSFYLLRNFPGRYDGAPVWVRATRIASNDGVSPVIIGGNDWAAAWAMNADGSFPYGTLPGGDAATPPGLSFRHEPRHVCADRDL